MRGIDSGPFKGSGDNARDGYGIGKSTEWSPHANENTAGGTSGAILLKVISNGLPDIWWQGEQRSSITFSLNVDFAYLPMDIIQSEVDDFAGPQAQPGKQQEDRKVTPSFSQ